MVHVSSIGLRMVAYHQGTGRFLAVLAPSRWLQARSASWVGKSSQIARLAFVLATRILEASFWTLGAYPRTRPLFAKVARSTDSASVLIGLVATGTFLAHIPRAIVVPATYAGHAC